MVHSSATLSCRRDVSPFIRLIRNAFFNRNWLQQLRWREDLSPRDLELPKIPDGPAHSLSNNFYHLRDNRRIYSPNVVILPEQKKLASGTERDSSKVSDHISGPIPSLGIYQPEVKSGETVYWRENHSRWSIETGPVGDKSN